jgi:hypothetical protein
MLSIDGNPLSEESLVTIEQMRERGIDILITTLP